MSAVAYRDFDLRQRSARQRGAPSARPEHGLIWRIFKAIERSTQRRTEEEAGRFIAEHGGRLTDDVERQLEGRFTGRGFLSYTPPGSRPPSPHFVG